eukprot:UN12045
MKAIKQAISSHSNTTNTSLHRKIHCWTTQNRQLLNLYLNNSINSLDRFQSISYAFMHWE